MPSKVRNKFKYPFDDMLVGDSFSVPLDILIKVRWAASQFGKKTGKKFSTRKHLDGARCWRIE